MDQRVKPSARIEPLPPEHSPDLKEQFESMRKNLGFIPNSILIMQRKPKMAKALAQMTASIWDPDSKVDRGLKRLIAHVASRTAGCQYCMAPYRWRRAALRRRRKKARCRLGLSDESALQRSGTGRARSRSRGRLGAECRDR